MVKYRDITAKDNQIIKLVTALQKSAKSRKENGLFVLEGLRLCNDAATCGLSFQTVIVSYSAAEKLNNDIEILTTATSDFVKVPDVLFKRISDTVTPQGILAIANIPEISKPISDKGRYIALEHVADPSNIGAIARTAEALGVSGLIVSNDSCDIYSPKVLRASMGTVLRLPIYFCDDIISFLVSKSLRGFACIPKETANLSFGKYKFADGDVVIIGNEANGISEKTIKNAYKSITINMSGRVESLNAASAAAIAIWELVK